MTLTIQGGGQNKSWVFTGLDGSIVCDSEQMNIYSGTTPMNDKVSGDGFPRLQPGVNTISWVGTVTSLVVQPRWVTLHHRRDVRYRGQEAVQRRGLQGHLPESAHLCAGGHRQPGGRVCAGSGGSAPHGGDLLLPVQRRHLFSGERRAPGPAHPGKAEGRAGTTA